MSLAALTAELVGRAIKMEFLTDGNKKEIFDGKITEVWDDKRKGPQVHIEFEDGDNRDMSVTDARKLLVDGGKPKGAAAGGKRKGESQGGGGKRARAPKREEEEEDEEAEAAASESEEEKPKKGRGKAKPAAKSSAKPPLPQGAPAKKSTFVAGGAAGVPAAASADVDAAALAASYQAAADELAGHAHAMAISKQEMDRLVSEVMRLLLFRLHKDGAPVSRADCMVLVNKAYKEKRGLGPAVLAAAQARFPALLGMEMVELEKAKPGGSAGAGDAKALLKAAEKADKGGSKVYVLRSLLPHALRARVVDLPEAAPAAGFTVAVLALVTLAGEGGLGEDALWASLGQLGVRQEAAGSHPTLGAADALLAQLVKQRFLQRAKGPDGAFVLYLAEQAMEPSLQRGVADFVKRLCGGAGGGGGAGGAGAAAAGAAGPSR